MTEAGQPRPGPTDGPPVLLKVEGAIATITINRPQARNALARGMGGMVCGHLRNLAADSAIRVVILRGAGRDFCPGGDIKTPPPAADVAPPPDFDAYQVPVLLHEMPQVTIAAIRGACAGAGLGWACACDLRLADDSARFNTAFLDVGVAGDMGVPWTLPRIVGAGRARDLMLLPRKLAAAEAQEIGLLEYLWPAAAFEEQLAQFAARLAAAAPMALKGIKAAMVEAERMDLRSFVTLESERHIRLLKSADHHEAVTAWTEGRAATFQGR